MESSITFTGSNSQENTQVVIHEEQHTFAERAANKISQGSGLTVLSSAPNSKVDSLETEDNAIPVTVTLITTLNALYKFLCAYGPGAFVEAGENDDLFDYLSTRVLLKAHRIGSCTGDVHFMITGPMYNVDELLQFFVQKSQTRTPYKLSTLISREYELSNFLTVNFEKEPTAYSLFPGHLATITSTRIDDISAYLIQIAVDEMNIPTTLIESILRFRAPPLTTSHITDTIKLSDQVELKFQSSDLGVGQKRYKTIELTKFEVTFLIGKQGRKIEQIRESSGATVKVIPLNRYDISVGLSRTCTPLTKQFIRISGTQSQINSALRLIEAEIFQLRSEGIVSY